MLPWQLIELAWTCTWFDCSQIIHQLYHDFSCVSPHVCRILLPVASPPPWKAPPTRDPAAHLRLLCHPALETVGVGGRRQAKNNKHTKWYPSHIIRNMIYNIYIYLQYHIKCINIYIHYIISDIQYVIYKCTHICHFFFRTFHKTKTSTASTIQASRSELLRMTRGEVRSLRGMLSSWSPGFWWRNIWPINIYMWYIYICYILYNYI